MGPSPRTEQPKSDSGSVCPLDKQFDGSATYHQSGLQSGEIVRRELFANVDYFNFESCDSQSCKTSNAGLSPGVIDGITKRLPSAETSNEAGE